MDCRTIREQMGLLIDGELPSDQATALDQHVVGCAACADEMSRLRGLTAALVATDPAGAGSAAPDLWSRIEQRLEPADRPQPVYRFLRRPLALAASLGLLVGAATFLGVWLSPSPAVVHADAIDYGLLLDGLSKDADASVNRFLQHYQATRMEAQSIVSQAAPMRFRIPETLSGGFLLQESYRLKFGHRTGYAARYRNATGEPVFVFFHPPCDKTTLGVHRESHCALAQGSHCVEVGDWQLIHYTDPTTCHCLLSRSSDEKLLRSILSDISGAPVASAPAHMH